MKVEFFERDGVLMVNVEVDASTKVDLVATSEHKKKYTSAWDEYCNPERAHNEDGTFKADDPATPENEAYKSKSKPKKKPAKKKAK